MDLQSRILEVKNTGMFNDEELEEVRNDMFVTFSSWEFYQIFHLTNEDIYYIDEETEMSLNSADVIQDTEKGRIYCFS